MGLFSKIGKALKKVGGFVKKAVGFASKVLNGPIGKLASFIPGVGPFIAGAAKIVGVADAVLNGKGLGGIVSGLVGNLGGGLLGKAGSLLSKTGLDSVIGFASKATNSSQLLDVISTVMQPRQNDTSAVAEGDRYNMQQLAAYHMAELLRAQQRQAQTA
ncbi:MAG: hypothetical protein DI536_12135 [Archangium gephyra]|uniref:Uncharacterized protein n=1 Tax=Archangium gephyra TaxID=48 RepID=A0A2W5TFF6_9BACT|nr:MAG: hypothetical protein DI536_12135 [Archangium gephyra]